MPSLPTAFVAALSPGGTQRVDPSAMPSWTKRMPSWLGSGYLRYEGLGSTRLSLHPWMRNGIWPEGTDCDRARRWADARSKKTWQMANFFHLSYLKSYIYLSGECSYLFRYRKGLVKPSPVLPDGVRMLRHSVSLCSLRNRFPWSRSKTSDTTRKLGECPFADSSAHKDTRDFT
jgi:hypothetical protein